MLDKKHMTEAEIHAAAKEIIENLRKYQPAIFEARVILARACKLLDHVVIREKE